jgi:molybdopterin-containing oxidoreductase family iron-sulfur binding subunit
MPTRQTIPIHPASDNLPDNPGRRHFMRWMAASVALGSAACSGPPAEKIVPYVHMPEGMSPGHPTFYATTLTRHGYGCGVLVESNMGRPTKVEGNPRHPASLGATSPFSQAAILQLWDPDRSQMPRQGGAPASWDAFETALAPSSRWPQEDGAGLRLLTGPVSAPTQLDQIQRLLARYPKAVWHSYDPLDNASAVHAAQLAFGRPLDMLLHLERAETIVVLDADLFGSGPGHLRHARDAMTDRSASAPRFTRRIYVAESAEGLTGAVADHRIALAPHEIERLTWRLAAKLGVPGMPAQTVPPATGLITAWEDHLAERLRATRQSAVLVTGPTLSAQTQALVHRMNVHLGAMGHTVVPIAPVLADTHRLARPLPELAEAMHGNAVDTLLMLDSNPVYDAPADLHFAQALKTVRLSVHHGLYFDETGQASVWHVPLAHPFEQWADARAWDGTASIVQPLIAPLYGGRHIHAVPAMLLDEAEHSDHDLVRRYWQRQLHGSGPGFESVWRTALQDGVIAGSASPAVQVQPSTTPLAAPTFDAPALRPRFVEDAAAGTGEFANNGWLQELPRPLTGLTWDNAAYVGPATARALDVRTGDVVRLAAAGAPTMSIVAPVWVSDRQAEGVVVLPLGYGRQAAGRVGNGVGFSAYGLMRASKVSTLTATAVGRRHLFVHTQQNNEMEGRAIIPVASAAQFRGNPRFASAEVKTPDASLYPPWPYPNYKWGMAIDLNTCIGCGACTIACQAENNIPVVGKEQVMRGRAMHWIRVDRYHPQPGGAASGQRLLFQPVPCMHCEDAPCELVCPVGAAVHDSEGLNVQVYNRCVGTRFCSNNCPYKVRRFNFLDHLDTALARPAPAHNPDVTVRRGGVMEKCTYCLQRITRARLAAEEQGRPLHDGEVVTACQAACPTQAITFGNLNDADSAVAQAKASPLDYGLLADLNTRPRTSYAAVVVNRDEDLARAEAQERGDA